MHDKPKFLTDSTPEKIQEIVLEGEKTNNRAYYCKVTILRRPSTGEYLGELYLEEESGGKEDSKKDGRSCRYFCSDDFIQPTLPYHAECRRFSITNF